MDKKDLIILVAAFAAIGFSLYRRYVQKNQRNPGNGSGTRQSGTSFPSSSKDDDYEPYSKK